MSGAAPSTATMSEPYEQNHVAYSDHRGYARETSASYPSGKRHPGRQPRDNDRGEDRRRRSNESMDQDHHYYGRGGGGGGGGRDNKRRYSEDDSYYGRRDSDRRSTSSKDSGYYGESSKDRGGKDDYYGSSSKDDYSRRSDNYYGRGYENDNRRERSKNGDSHEEDWICVKCSCKNRSYERRCYDCGKYQGRSPVSSEDEFGRPMKRKDKKPQWPPLFEGNNDKFVLDSRSGMFYDAKSDFFYDPTSRLYYGNKKKAYFTYNGTTKKFEPVNASEGEVQPAAPRGSSGDADVADADQMMIMPHGADAVKKEVAASTPKIAINIKTAPLKSDNKKRKKRSESNADTTKKESAVTTSGAPPNKVPKQHAANIEKWQVRQRELNPKSQPRVTNQGKPVCWLCQRKFASEEKLKLHEAKSQLHKDNLDKQPKEEPKPVVEGGSYVDRAKHRRDLYGPDLVAVPAITAPEVTLFTEPVESDRPMDNPATNIGHQMMEKMGWTAGGALGRGSEEQQQQQAALAKDWDRIEGIAAQNSISSARRPR